MLIAHAEPRFENTEARYIVRYSQEADQIGIMYPMLEAIDHRPSDLILPMPLTMLCNKYTKRIAAAHNEQVQKD